MSTLTGKFGTVEYDETDVVTFHEGIVGFPHLTKFLVTSHREDTPFRWLQSIDEPGFAMLVVSPETYVGNYSPSIDRQDAAELGITDSSFPLLYVTVTIPTGRPQDLTVNLAGPIVINPETRSARQFIVEHPSYTTKYKVFSEPQHGQARAA